MAGEYGLNNERARRVNTETLDSPINITWQQESASQLDHSTGNEHSNSRSIFARQFSAFPKNFAC